MAERVDLKIFHYHLQTGGVSTVVLQALQVFRAHLPSIRSIELIAGFIPEDFRSQAERCSGRCTVVPDIGYRQPVDQSGDQPADIRRRDDRKSTAELARKLAERLLGSFGSDESVWWVHNYHLGKNPVLTQALLHIIDSGAPQRMVLQIHDFPECGRFQNLALLRRTLSLDPYPVSPWVRYAVLNRRDRDVLLRAGIPEQAVFLLENPVLARQAVEPKRIADSLKRLFAPSFPRYDPKAPLLLYPIRTIRRKNALEAVLLCLLLEKKANLVITLPGISAAERPYSDRVQALFADQVCPGLWGIGPALERHALGFEDLVAGSDLIVSASVQEGFGYLFVNALLWSLPLAARSLDTLEDLKKDLFSGYPAHFYDTLRVPVSDEPSLVQAYRRKIDRLADMIPEAEQDRLLQSVETLVRDGLADFSYLPVERQESVLREIAGGRKETLQSCRGENRAAITGIEGLLASGSPAADSGAGKAEEVERRFGAAAYAARFRRIIESFDRNVPTFPSPGIGERILKAFLELQHLRLLYD
jgi:hypothetical protein